MTRDLRGQYEKMKHSVIDFLPFHLRDDAL